MNRLRSVVLAVLYAISPLFSLSPATFTSRGAEPESAVAQAAQTAPLYLLTYDHGGIILWGTDQFAERLRNAITWLDRYPHFKIGLDNEAYLYDALAEQDPALLNELRDDLKRYAGRFGIGTCTYGQPLSAFINEESNVRQLVYGIRTQQKRLGTTPTIYLMSEHAMHSQIPQLLVGCGFKGAIMRTHFMMYGYNPTFDVPIGWWVGLDGSRLPTVPTYHGEGAAFGRTTVDNWILTRYPSPDAKTSLDDFRREFGRINPLLASRADDSGLRQEALVQQGEGNPNRHWILLGELLSLFPQPSVEMKTMPNDFITRMPWGYCGNTIWNDCRQAEVQVLIAERLAALAFLLGGDSHEDELAQAWRDLLVAQHHDVQICGLLAEAQKFLPASLAVSAKVHDAALAYVAARMRGEGLRQVTAFNPVSWTRTEWLQAEFAFTEKGKARSFIVRQGAQGVPAVLLDAERYSDGSLMTARIAFPAEVPGLAFRAFSIIASTNASVPTPTSGATRMAVPRVESEKTSLTIRTPDLEVRLNPAGGLVALNDRVSGKPFLQSGRHVGLFAATINGQSCESSGHWLIEPAGESAPWVIAREDGRIADIPYTAQLTFRADTPRIDCHVQFHFDGQKIGRLSNQPRDGASGFVHEQKLRFKLFPALGPGASGVRDLPFAVAETTNRYVEGIYWTAVTDQQTGLAIFNRGNMGLVREADGGLSIPLAYAMYYIWGTRMLKGDYTYDFALYPFRGDWRRADLHRQAMAYNFPLQSVVGQPGNGALGIEARPVEINSEDAILSALYSEAGRIYARLYETQGQTATASVVFRENPSSLTSVDLLGHGDAPVQTPVSFTPWQIRTLTTKRP